jgi:hexosaminidase
MTTTLRGNSILLVGAALIVACRPTPRQQEPVPTFMPRPAVIPRPASLTLAGGAPFALDSATDIVVRAMADSSQRIAEALAFQLRPPTGFPLSISDTGAARRNRIRLHVDAGRAELADEGYALVVTADSVNLTARTMAGLYRGTQTIRQLFPFGIESENSVNKMGDWKIPAVSIVDRPRFAWRGAMLDVSRHFFSVDEVKQYVDILALYKFNVLHLHLADDQGWRIEIKSRPALTAMASGMQVGGGAGGFYTQADYSEIVRYAAERFITVVPEIDMPGHTNAMLIPFPDLSCGREKPAPYTSIRVGFSALCPDKEETYRLVDDVVREIAALTPGPYFHVGGDEVETLTREQYARFVERVQEIVGRHGKRMVGWEEIVKARLRPNTLVQQWHTDSARNAVQYGAKIILSPASKTYLDMKYTPATELGLRWAGLIEVQTAYEWDPATHIAGVAEPNIAGVEAPLWAETIRNMTAAQYLALPRLPAIAEVAWTPQADRRWDDFRRRLAAHAPRWRLLGMNYYASPQVPW